MKPRNYRDPNYFKLKCLMSRKERKSRKKEFLKLDYIDPGKLLELLKDLNDCSGIMLQIKVNAFLQRCTSAALSFIIEDQTRVPEAIVRVIGTSELYSTVVFQVDNTFMTKLRKSDGPVCFKNCFVDTILLLSINECLLEENLSPFENIVVFPIYHPYTKKIIFYSGLVNYDSVSHPIAYYHGMVGECYRYCHEIVLNTLRYEEEKLHHHKYKSMIELALKLTSNIDNLPQLMSIIRSEVCNIFSADKCRIFFLEDKKVVTNISNYGDAFDTSNEALQDLKIPLGVGLAGTVAQTAKIINCYKPEEDELYLPYLESINFERSKNILTFPMLVYRGVFGVVQVHNKNNSWQFDAIDVLFARYLGPIFGINIYICLNKKKLWNAINRRDMTDALFFEDSLVTDAGEVNEVEMCTKTHEHSEFLSYSFLPAAVDKEDLICTCERIFNEYGLLKEFNIPRRNFIKLLIRIRNRHYFYPLHNWNHSYCTFHFIHTLVTNEELVQTNQITPSELFAMLLAGLSHAMEFRGATTPYQPTAGTTMASLYSSPGSVIQHYSLVQLVRMMSCSDCIITETMEIEVYRNLLKQLDRMMLYMDLSNHVYSREKIDAISGQYDPTDREHLQLMQSLVMTCGLLSDYCKPFGYCNNLADTSMNEFFNNDTTECRGVIDVDAFIDNILLKKVDLQIHFMKNICEEAFRLLKDIFPGTVSCYDTVVENTLEFRKKKDEIIQQQMEQF